MMALEFRGHQETRSLIILYSQGEVKGIINIALKVVDIKRLYYQRASRSPEIVLQADVSLQNWIQFYLT